MEAVTVFLTTPFGGRPSKFDDLFEGPLLQPVSTHFSRITQKSTIPLEKCFYTATEFLNYGSVKLFIKIFDGDFIKLWLYKTFLETMNTMRGFHMEIITVFDQ